MQSVFWNESSQTSQRAATLAVGWLFKRSSDMLVFLRDGSVLTTVRAATLIEKLQIKFAISPSHNLPTPGQPVQALIRKTPHGESGIEPDVSRSRGGRLNHKANEAVLPH